MLTHARLLELVSYSALTGAFSWRTQPEGCSGPYQDRYHRIRLDRELYLSHRVAWFYHYGEWPKGHLDHKDRNKLNNAIDNLRIVNRAMQRANSTKASTSGLKGVTIIAQITIDGKHVHLGSFPTPEAAHEAYCKKAKEVWGEHFYDGK